MIQRIQSLWLLLAGVAGLITYKMPLWTGKLLSGAEKPFVGTESLALFAVIVLTCILGFVTIFLFRDRKLQKNLSLLGMFLSMGIIALEFFIVDDYKKSMGILESSWKIGAIMPILMVVFFFLAYRGIRSDEKLIKSVDRLR